MQYDWYQIQRSEEMPGPKDRNDPQKAPEPKTDPNTEPKKGGFGAFTDKYRERWEKEHPNAHKSDKEQQAPGSPTTGKPNDTPGRSTP